MSAHSIPKNIDPLKYADQAKTLEGEIRLNLLPRFSDMLLSDEGNVKVKLEFGRDQQGLRIVQGQCAVSVSLRCERCLQPVTQKLASDFTLGIVFSDDDAKQLPKSYEPLLVDPENLDTYELLEEELILTLPMFAYHDECASDYDVQAQAEVLSDATSPDAESDETTKRNPFSVLAGFKPGNSQK